MKNLNVYSFSNSDDMRHIVIDHSVLIEEITTETIGRLLNIDWKESKSLGSGSGSITFQQKILMIRDIIGIETVPSKKIDAFIMVRNKFAHIRKVSDWNHLFLLGANYSRLENDLKSWYKDVVNNEDNNEDYIRLLYFHLTREIFYFLIQININWAHKIGYQEGQNQIKTDLFNFVMRHNKNESVDINKFWDELKSPTN